MKNIERGFSELKQNTENTNPNIPSKNKKEGIRKQKLNIEIYSEIIEGVETFNLKVETSAPNRRDAFLSAMHAIRKLAGEHLSKEFKTSSHKEENKKPKLECGSPNLPVQIITDKEHNNENSY